jgi:hypothetical protein
MNVDEWLIYIVYICAGISILNCFTILSIYLYKKSLRSWAMELVAYLMFSAMMNSLSFTLLYVKDDDITGINMTMCNLQAFLMMWFEFSMFLWASIIGISIYKNVINHKLNRPEWRQRTLYLCIGYFVPFIAALTAYSFDTFGVAGKWCWINTYNPTTSVYIFCIVIYITYWVLIIANLVLTFMVSRKLSSMSVNRAEKDVIRRLVFKILRYPVIQFICLLPPTINKIIDATSGGHNFILWVVHIIFIALQGFFYSIAYGYNRLILNAISELIKRVFCCVKTLPEEEEYSEQNSLNKTYDDTTLMRDKSLVSEL